MASPTQVRILMLIVNFFILTSVITFAQDDQPHKLRKQFRNSDQLEPLTTAERAELGDPLFNLVLKDHTETVDLARIEELIQPDPKQRHVFVVDETIVDNRRPQGGRRAVIAFSGQGPNGEELTGNVMLSVFFNSEAFPESQNIQDPLRNLEFIEAWGWDNLRGRYNYYRLDSMGSRSDLTWKFRTSSLGADQLSLEDPRDRRDTCLGCHINGAPIMKELFFPWNNWHSTASSATYLQRTAAPAERWPVAMASRLTGEIVNFRQHGGLASAQILEKNIISAIRQFNTRRINIALKRRDDDGNLDLRDGQLEIMDAKRLLRHLFVTTEFNITTAERKSGLHPFPEETTQGPAGTVVIPDSFFLNVHLIRGGGFSGLTGLGITQVDNFSRQIGAELSPEEYKTLVTASGVRLNRLSGQDADFAWLVPEPSQIDNDMVDQLMMRGIVTPHFVAAVLLIDLETPILSDARQRLAGDSPQKLEFIPNQFRFRPLAPGDDRFDLDHHRQHELTQKVIVAIEQTNPAPNSPRSRFLRLLKAEDPNNSPHKQLEQAVVGLTDRLKTNPDRNNSQRRVAELKQLYDLAIQRRQAIHQHPVLSTLDETLPRGGLLFPIPRFTW